MKKLHIFMLSAAFLFGGCKATAQTSLSDIIMPFPAFALGAIAIHSMSLALDVLDKTTDLGEKLDKQVATDNKRREEYGLKPQSFLQKWSLITDCLSKIALGISTLPITLNLLVLNMSSAIAKGEF